MVQKAEQHYDRDYHDTYGRSQDQNKWIWGALAALAALALIVWFATSGGPNVSPVPSGATTTEQSTTAPAQPPAAATTAEEPAATPAPAPAPAPEAAPATGNSTQQ
jgi:hypothetical protein